MKMSLGKKKEEEGRKKKGNVCQIYFSGRFFRKKKDIPSQTWRNSVILSALGNVLWKDNFESKFRHYNTC